MLRYSKVNWSSSIRQVGTSFLIESFTFYYGSKEAWDKHNCDRLGLSSRESSWNWPNWYRLLPKH
ncbi:MAG: hypothetical protein ACI97A_002171 [Planctomycetota bacterium]|jgi:hypothetical protein